MNATSIRDALRAIAARSFEPRSDALGRFDASGNREFLPAVSRERLTGLTVEAAVDGDLVLSEDDFAELLERHEDQLALDLRLDLLLCEAAAVLERAGIAYRALKGPLLAHTLYRDPALRSYGDIDLLVPGIAFDAAIDALQPLGFHRRFAEPRRGFDARFAKGACLERGDGMELDLHRTLAPGVFGLMLGHAELFARPAQPFAVGGRWISGLDRESAFVHACFHAALGDDPPRLIPIVDVAVLLEAGFDAAAVVALATEAHCEVVLGRALALLDEELGVRLECKITAWVHGYQPSRFDRWALRSYERSHRSYAGQAAVSLWAMPSMRDRVTYASALAFPSRNYLRARERGYGRRLRHSVHLVHEWRPR